MYTKSNRRYGIIASSIALFAIIGLSLWGMVYVGSKINKNVREGLLLRAGTIAQLISVNDIQNLTGTDADIGTTSYEHLKRTLENVHVVNTDSRFVYLMGLRGGSQFFYVDSENPSSKDYSPPGQPYNDATELDIYNHTRAIAYTSGPYTDEWGTWISAYYPVLDPDTGQVLALVGMDVDAKNILESIRIAREAVLIISILLFLVIVLLVFLIQRSNAYGTELEKVNQDLSAGRDHLLEVKGIARLGQLTWSAATNDVLIDKVVMDLIWSKQSKLSLTDLMGYVNHEDVVRIQKELEEMPHDSSFATFKYGIKSPDQKEHEIMSLCKIKRDGKGNPLRVVCTVQDIGDSQT